MRLSDFLKRTPRAAIAFSGGVDSAFLLYAALQTGVQVRAYFVRSVLQPEWERRDAVRMAEHLGADLKMIPEDMLSDPNIAANPPERCYYCKRKIMERIDAEARGDGFPVLWDGTNASDDPAERPGMRALDELSVQSPLRLCGLTKPEIRRLSRQAGLFTWNKPSCSCLATRIPSGTPLTQYNLARTDRAEQLLSDLDFTNFRVRTAGDAAKIQLPAAQMDRLLQLRGRIVPALRAYYDAVWLDLEGRT